MTVQAQSTDRQLKIVPQMFTDIIEGRKRFEVRKREPDPFILGERLLLREFNPSADEYTGREAVVEVTYSCPLDFMGLLGYDGMNIRVLTPWASTLGANL